MQPEAKDSAHLWDMLDAARAVERFVRSKTFSDYAADRMLRGAVERHIEIIGEAASRVSAEFRKAHPGIPWQRIIAQRNVLAHEYGELDDALIWRVATARLPELISELERIMPPLPPEGS
jgi:uncharacterized protein with HEPN domain